MNSCVPPFRKIASNRLWTPGGVLRHPVVTLSAQGRIVGVAACDEPDRQPFTEFYAGLLVADFPADYRAAFERLRTLCAEPAGGVSAPQSGQPLSLDEALRRLVPARGGCLVALFGLEYAPLRLTAQSGIRFIAGEDAPRPSDADVRGRDGCKSRS